MNNVYLEIRLPLGNSLHWHVNARDAREALVDAAARMRCRIVGNGSAGKLVSLLTDTVKATYAIGINK